MPESKELVDYYKEKNKEIAQGIKGILDKKGWWDIPEIVQSVTFNRIDNPHYSVRLEALCTRTFSYNGEDEELEIFGSPPPPQRFKLPIYSFATHHEGEIKEGERATTPFGVLEEYFIAPDGALYIAVNYFYFNEEGQGAKSEIIKKMTGSGGIFPNFTLEDVLKNVFKLDEIASVDYIPEAGIRFVDLEPGDYEKVEGVLHQIETGVLTVA